MCIYIYMYIYIYILILVVVFYSSIFFGGDTLTIYYIDDPVRASVKSKRPSVYRGR